MGTGGMTDWISKNGLSIVTLLIKVPALRGVIVTDFVENVEGGTDGNSNEMGDEVKMLFCLSSICIKKSALP
jgi:hypothetical protein